MHEILQNRKLREYGERCEFLFIVYVLLVVGWDFVQSDMPFISAASYIYLIPPIVFTLVSKAKIFVGLVVSLRRGILTPWGLGSGMAKTLVQVILRGLFCPIPLV